MRFHRTDQHLPNLSNIPSHIIWPNSPFVFSICDLDSLPFFYGRVSLDSIFFKGNIWLFFLSSPFLLLFLFSLFSLNTFILFRPRTFFFIIFRLFTHFLGFLLFYYFFLSFFAFLLFLYWLYIHHCAFWLFLLYLSLLVFIFILN